MLSKLRDRLNSVIDPVARGFAKAGFTPNVLTAIGAAIGIIAAILFVYGQQLAGGLVLLVCGFFDIMDGAVARVSGRVTAFGGVLDSVVDRYVDFLVLFGIMWAGLANFVGVAGILGSGWLWGTWAIVGSLMVSYVRARGEAAGTGKLDVGVAERAERMLILAFGGILALMPYAVVLVVIITHLTVIHRIAVARLRLGRL